MSIINRDIENSIRRIADGAEIAAEQISDWQQIRAFISARVGNIELNDRQKELLKKYQFIYDKMSSGKYTELQIAKQVCNAFGVAKDTANRHVADTRELFGSIISVNKYLELTILLNVSKRRANKAEADGDMKTVAALEKNQIAILKELPEIEQSAGEFFEGHVLEAMYDPALLGAKPVDLKEVLQVINEKRGKKIKMDFIEDAEVMDS